VELDAGSAGGSDSSPEVVVLPQVAAKPVERPPLPVMVVKTAEVRELTVNRASESVAIRVEQRTFLIPSRAASDV
jgi:hypothetical protein